jgi:hypothetical protein
MRKIVIVLLLAVLIAGSIMPGFASPLAVTVPTGAVGTAENGSLIVAQKGSVVYARKGSNVQHWPGSKLVPASRAGSVPDCSKSSVTASGSAKELFVGSGAQACTAGDIAVIALDGATVIYDDAEVPLIRRPVNRR